MSGRGSGVQELTRHERPAVGCLSRRPHARPRSLDGRAAPKGPPEFTSRLNLHMMMQLSTGQRAAATAHPDGGAGGFSLDSHCGRIPDR